MLELVRYIHLNPLRAGLLKSVEELDSYAYCGHSRLMGKIKSDWQDTDSVLSFLGSKVSLARKLYKEYMVEGVAEGRRPELTGGGLVRSNGGWEVLRSLRRMGLHLKGDERILGDSDFVESVLAAQEEKMERRYRLRAIGYDFERLVQRVAELLTIEPREVLSSGKQPHRVRARSLLCYWAVRELGMSNTGAGKRLGITQPGVCRAVRRGEEFAVGENFEFPDKRNS